MSDFDEFMDDPYQEEVGGGDFSTIARAKILRAFQGWQFGGNPRLFPFSNKKDAVAAKEECAEYCQGEKSYPQLGIVTVVYGDDIPSHPEGAMDSDWYDFVPVFHSKEKYTGRTNVSGEHPYDLVLEGLKANPSVFNQVQWCELERPIDNVREPGRNKDNSKYAHRVYVVTRVFKSREEAYEAAGKSPDTRNYLSSNVTELSDLATSADWTLASLQAQAENILSSISDAVAGKGTPDGKAMSSEQAQKFVCENFAIEVSDLALISIDEVPF
jgi:hypothetical protein